MSGWKRFRTNTVTRDYLFCVMARYISVPRLNVEVALSTHTVDPQLFSMCSLIFSVWDIHCMNLSLVASEFCSYARQQNDQIIRPKSYFLH